MASLRGTHLGRYRIGELLGSGGFAAVYQARDEGLETDVAIKVLADIHSFDPEARERFLAEGRMLRRVRHPNVIQVHDIGETNDGQPYLVLQLGERGSLAQRFTADTEAPSHDHEGSADLLDGTSPADQPIFQHPATEPPPRSYPAATAEDLRLVADSLTQGLGALHRAGIVHRDISPANLFITTDDDTTAPPGTGPPPPGLFASDEALLIGDLGLAKDITQGSGLTVGAGTLYYSAPEQRTPYASITPAADIFAASRVITELAANSPLADAVATAVAGGLAEDPSARPETIEAWRADLELALTPDQGAVPAPAPSASPEQSSAATAETTDQSAAESVAAEPVSSRRQPLAWVALGAVGLVVAGLAAWFLLIAADDGGSREQADPTLAAPSTPLELAPENSWYQPPSISTGWENLSWGDRGPDTFNPTTGAVQFGQFAGVSLRSLSDGAAVDNDDWLLIEFEDLQPDLDPTTALAVRANGEGDLCGLGGTDFVRTDPATGGQQIVMPAELLIPASSGGTITRISLVSSGNQEELTLRLLGIGLTQTGPWVAPESTTCGS